MIIRMVNSAGQYKSNDLADNSANEKQMKKAEKEEPSVWQRKEVKGDVGAHLETGVAPRTY